MGNAILAVGVAHTRYRRQAKSENRVHVALSEGDDAFGWAIYRNLPDLLLERDRKRCCCRLRSEHRGHKHRSSQADNNMAKHGDPQDLHAERLIPTGGSKRSPANFLFPGWILGDSGLIDQGA